MVDLRHFSGGFEGKAAEEESQENRRERWVPALQGALIGHKKQERILLEAYRAGRLHHAWIFSGPLGVGKATLAFRFARFVQAYPDPLARALKGRESLQTPFSSAFSPDIFHITCPWDEKTKCFKQEIPIASLRILFDHLQKTAHGTGGGWRFCIIDQAHEMNMNAANALLKILEEPPERVVFILVTCRAQRLFPTLRSRCVQLSFFPLSSSEILEAIALLRPGFSVSEKEREQLISFSEGSLQRACLFFQEGVSAVVALFQKILEKDTVLSECRVHLLVERLNALTLTGVHAWDLFKDLLLDYLTRSLRRSVAQGEANRMLLRWANAWEKISDLLAKTESFNLERTQLVLSCFSFLREEGCF